MRYYLSILPDKCQQTVQDDVSKFWNLARNFEDGNELVLVINKGKSEWTQKASQNKLIAISYFNPLHPDVAFLYPLKTSENLKVF